MEGKSHFIGGSVGVMVGYIYLSKQGMLVSDINPVLQACIMYPFGIHGGMLPDIDHHKDATPLKDPVNMVINRVIHIPNVIRKSKPYTLAVKDGSFLDRIVKFLCVNHRSWQTHGIEVFALLVYFTYLLMTSHSNSANHKVLLLVLLGECLGMASHLILDYLTTEGVPFASISLLKVFFPKLPLPTRLSFVPKTSSGFFSTGHTWELVIRELLKASSYFLVIYIVLGWLGYSIAFVH